MFSECDNYFLTLLRFILEENLFSVVLFGT